MKRKLTEREVWQMLADAWKNPVENESCISSSGEVMVMVDMGVGEGGSEGLCTCIDDLYKAGMITERMEKTMWKKIDEGWVGKGRQADRGPIPMEGAKERRKFCLERVRELTRKKVTK